MSEHTSGALSLGEIIKDKAFRVPLYQRNYKWSCETAQKLAQDLVEAYRGEQRKSIGLITLYEDNGTFDVIDGQQRLITLSILFGLLERPNVINLCFGRDYDDNKKVREAALKGIEGFTDNTTDTDRIFRNREAIEKVLTDHQAAKGELDKNAFAEYILENCIMLCSVMENAPVDEFMNLNAYKTAFSACDYVRSNLIMLNTFYKKDLEKNIAEISGCLSRYTYKTAVAELYNQILDILYTDMTDGDGKEDFSSPYRVLVNFKRCSNVRDADITNESRINIIFSPEKEVTGYRYDPGNKDFDGWKKELIRMSWISRLLERLSQDMEKGDFSAVKAIDNYEKLKGKSFLSLLSGSEEDEKLSLSQLLEKYSNVNSVLVRQISGNDLKLANRYFEAYASAYEKKETNNEAETDSDCKTPHMSDFEIAASISGAGRYILDRFLTEQRYETDSRSKVPPMLELEDRENSDLGGVLAVGDNDSITPGELFKNVIKIPVIQRDYCMGAQLGTENESSFLTYLIKHFEKNPEKKLNVSTILVSKEKNNNAVYIFDGQQRTFTLYQILKYCGYFDEKHNGFEFIGRNQQRRRYGSRYSEKAAAILHKQLEDNSTLKSYDNRKTKAFADFLLNNVTFTVKQVIDGEVSSAEQFFMDINGGVPLEPYEIYKSCLCDRLKGIDEAFADRFMHLLENQWLNAVYKLLNIKREDGSDIEEITEIRVIEYLCRYFYREKKGKKADAFDALGSKSAVVERTKKYLDELEREDFENVEKCMNVFVKHMYRSDRYVAKIKEDKFQFWSNKSYTNLYAYIRTVVSETDIIQPTEAELIPCFVSSFSPENRKMLLSFYSCEKKEKEWEGHKWLMEEVYDKDEFAAFIIHKALGKTPMPVSYCRTDRVSIAEVVIVGGYKNIKVLDDKHIGGYIGKYDIYEKEIPAYYADMKYVFLYYPTVRPHYLYAAKGKKAINPKKVSFCLTRGDGGDMVKLPNGENHFADVNGRKIGFSLSRFEKLRILQIAAGYCIFATSNNEAQRFTLNRLDAYCLASNDAYFNLLDFRR